VESEKATEIDFEIHTVVYLISLCLESSIITIQIMNDYWIYYGTSFMLLDLK